MFLTNRRRRFRFTEKVHSKKGITALSIAGLCLFIYLLFVFLAFKGAGNLSTYYGSAGVLVTIISIVSLVLAFQSTREEDSFQLFPRIAFVVSLISCICWIGSYVIGFTLL